MAQYQPMVSRGIDKYKSYMVIHMVAQKTKKIYTFMHQITLHVQL